MSEKVHYFEINRVNNVGSMQKNIFENKNAEKKYE